MTKGASALLLTTIVLEIASTTHAIAMMTQSGITRIRRPSDMRPVIWEIAEMAVSTPTSTGP
ncbi:hypothetical protein [Micromonospora sp. NPDC050200]|uniref:hypothetical protein n=1 Tax=Micromonospora sp. NPDC050200 TaxID=3155664 RepID=UPI0033C8E397